MFEERQERNDKRESFLPSLRGWSEEAQEQNWVMEKEFMAGNLLLSNSAAEAVADGLIVNQRN